jgi:hypothetical protein
MMHARAAVLVMTLSVVSQPVFSQSSSDISAHAALLNTPVGALAPMASAPAPGAAQTHTLSLRVGQYSVTGLDATSYGATLSHAGSRMTHSITAAVRTCAACDKTLMLGLNVRHPLVRATTGTRTMGIAASVGAGYGKADDVSAASLVLGAPISIALDRTNKSRLSAFVTPGLGWGRLSTTGTNESGTRPMIGAGAGWTAPAGWGIHVGYQKIVIEDGGGTAGIAFSIRRAK